MSAADIINDPTVRGWAIVIGSTVGGFVGQVVQLRFIRNVVRKELASTQDQVREHRRKVALLEKGFRWLTGYVRAQREARHHG
jgi:hypothetical protein